ncbi:hypothetical protein KAJ27_00105 [bacterium]|nr:hypothetical protein [bacterium]
MQINITKTYINGQETDSKDLIEIFSAFSNANILIEKGGFLFRSLFIDGELHIGFLPCFINGRKTFHYEAKMNMESEFTLIGWISSSGEFGILFRPVQKDMTPEIKEQYLINYIAFADCLIDNGFKGPGKFEFITSQALKGLGIDGELPKTLMELTQLSKVNL